MGRRCGDGNLKAAVASTSPQHETLVVNSAITRGSTPLGLIFKSPEQVIQENHGLRTIQGAGQLAVLWLIRVTVE